MSIQRFLPVQLKGVQELTKSLSGYDALCVLEDIPSLLTDFEAIKLWDKSVDDEVSCFKSVAFDCRVIYSPVNIGDYDDVRRYSDAAKNALLRALKAGARAPILVLPASPAFKNGDLVALLGALSALYVPIQLREDVPSKKQRFPFLGVFLEDKKRLNELIEQAEILETALFVARDLGGGDPERMAPPRVEEYVDSVFSKIIEKKVIKDVLTFTKSYPLYQAVNRAAAVVPRHNGRIIFLEYKPRKAARKTLMLIGKGVTYDTGGADIKAGGIMAGMSRDKCGASNIAGFMKIVEAMQPEDIHVVAALCMVRNSVGEECHVADEMITSRAGVRVRVCNTDAEGRMAMADTLCEMKERVLKEKLADPHLYTIATLTGHACLAVGEYSICMDNAPAMAVKHAQKLQLCGEAVGDPFEISVLRREDFDFHRGKCYGEDVIQCNNAASSRNPRGHQTPAAFLNIASGLDQHGLKSSTPIKYSHLDIAGSAGDVPHPPTGASILALAELHLK